MFSSHLTDEILRAPLLGCSLMCAIAGLIGNFLVLEKKSLIGEALSHVVYPGVVLALFAIHFFLPQNGNEIQTAALVLIVAALTSFAGLWAIDFLQKRGRLAADAALTMTLASFFGLGLFFLSCFESDFPKLYRESENFLFGQAATMRDIHIAIAGVLATGVVALVFLFFRPLFTTIFDPIFASVIGISKNRTNLVLFFMVVLMLVIGMRALGVVLMSASLLFPAITARQLSSSLPRMLAISTLVGALSGFLGVALSHEISLSLSLGEPIPCSVPTGPAIVIVSGGFFLLSLLFSLKRGIFALATRKILFHERSEQENLMKALWKYCSKNEQTTIGRATIHEIYPTRPRTLFFAGMRGWLRKKGRDEYEITPLGLLWGRKIIRLHRLWEVYLVKFCRVSADRVHPSAEEMEHIITPEIERELDYLLGHPMEDPHEQPIPKREDDSLYKSLLRY
jgi:manganese/zinc/iron transport system permease protein